MSTEPDAPPSDDDATRQDAAEDDNPERVFPDPDPALRDLHEPFPDPAWAADWTEEARAKALGVFAGITDWFSRAATSYAFAPHEARIYRDRMRKLARIMRATLYANFENDDEFLQKIEAKARTYLESKTGQNITIPGLVIMGGDVCPDAADHKRSLLHFIAGYLYLLSHHFDKYADDEFEVAKWTANHLAEPFIYKFFDLYADDIDPRHNPDESSVALVAQAMKWKLIRRSGDGGLESWIKWGGIVVLIETALESLGHKNPKSFVSTLRKDTDPDTIYFLLDDDERAVIVSEDPEGKTGHVIVFDLPADEAE
jgi:hypothetical protein